MTATATTPARFAARARRRSELALGLLVVIVTGGGYVLVSLAEDTQLPADLWVFLAWVFGLYLLAHIAVRRFAGGADATLLPLVGVLNGIGFVTISRLDRDLARIQAGWVAVGVGAFVATLLVVRDVRVLQRNKYTCLLFGIGFLLLPLVPGIGRTLNGARLWASIGPLNFQPGEIAKVLLVVFFAGYLVETRELLAGSFVRLRHLGPLFLAWGASIFVMVFEKDLGSSLLLFGVFVAMLYMATNQAWYLAGALFLFVLAVLGLYTIDRVFELSFLDHVQVRIDTWHNPWADAQGSGYQIIQSWYAFGTGGIGGTGLGLGNPDKIPNAPTDFIFAAIGEELGLVGTTAIVIGFMLLVGSAFRVAVDAVRPFSKLFAAGLAATIALQSFIILAGVTRLIPLTGITLPFVSYGGSSLVANFVVLALLLRISDETARARSTP